jgi:hypothetical protein
MLQVYIMDTIDRHSQSNTTTASQDTMTRHFIGDESVYDKITNDMIGLGFSRDEALEATLVTEGKGHDAALDYLFSSPETRKSRRESALLLGRRVPRMNHTLLPQDRGLYGPDEEKHLLDQLAMWEEKAHNEDQRISELQIPPPSSIPVASDNVHRGLQQGFLADGHGLSSASRALLSSWGVVITPQSPTPTPIESLDMDRECLLCMERARDQVQLQCMHVCYCHACIPNLRPDDKCPMCQQDIQQFRSLGL